MNGFFVRTDDKILFQSFEIHALAIVSDHDFIRCDLDIDFCGICIIGIVDQLPQELDAFCVQALSY